MKTNNFGIKKKTVFIICNTKFYSFFFYFVKLLAGTNDQGSEFTYDHVNGSAS